MVLNRVMEIWTPLVEENPGLNAWPPPFTAKGVRVDPKMRSYRNTLLVVAIVSWDVPYNRTDVFGGARLDGACGSLTGRDNSVRIVGDILG
jgi:hypothetical protein